MSTLLAATFVLLLGAGTPLRDQGLHYRGPLTDGSATGRVEVLGAAYSVSAGDLIPGWGRVKAVTARALVIERALTEAERQAREAQGLLAADVLEMRIPVATGNAVSAGGPPGR
jgi:hypothetical protein